MRRQGVFELALAAYVAVASVLFASPAVLVALFLAGL